MTIGIIANLEKESVTRVVSEVVDWLKGRNVDFVVDVALMDHLEASLEPVPALPAETFREKCHMVLSFGGDGTILSTARLLGHSGIPILGVKMGGMGFLAELAPDELFDSLDGILDGNYEIVERMVLQANFGSNETLFALNDFVFDKGAVSRIIRINTSINQEYLNTYIGDGLIVSSPTGSTAYSLAAGGPILLPSMDAIIINPISPHSLGARPVVIPADMTVRVEIEAAQQQVMLSADGQVSYQLQPGQSVEIKKTDYRVRLVSYAGRSFYDVLRAKLNWGEDIRKA